MKGVRFYLEYSTNTKKNAGTVKNPGDHTGNSVAVMHENWRECDLDDSSMICFDACVGIHDKPNSFCVTSTVSEVYLKKLCKRIPEKLAREIHPELFKRLEE